MQLWGQGSAVSSTSGGALLYPHMGSGAAAKIHFFYIFTSKI